MITTGSTIVFAKPSDKVPYSTTVDSGPDLGEVRIVDAEDDEVEDGELGDTDGGITGWVPPAPRLSLRSLGEVFPLDDFDGRSKGKGTADEELGIRRQNRPPTDPG